jgi:hypothetical protein
MQEGLEAHDERQRERREREKEYKPLTMPTPAEIAQLLKNAPVLPAPTKKRQRRATR